MTAYFPHKTIAFLLMSTAFACITKGTAGDNIRIENMFVTVLTEEQTTKNEPNFSRPNTPELRDDISLTDETDTQTPEEQVPAEQPYSVNPEDMVFRNEQDIAIGQNLERAILPIESFYESASDIRGRKTFNSMRFFNVEEIFARLDFSVESNQFHADIHNSATGPKTSFISRKTATYRVHDDDGAATIAVAYMLTVQNLLQDMSWFADWDGPKKSETTTAEDATVEMPAATATRQDMIRKLKEATFPVKWHLFRKVATAALTYRVGYLNRIIKNSNNIDENRFYQSMIQEIQTMQTGIFTQYQAADQSPSYEEFADSVGQWLQKILPNCAYITNVEHTTMKTFSPVSASVVVVDDAINKLLYYYPYDLNLTEAQFSCFQSGENNGFWINFKPNQYPFTSIPGIMPPVHQTQKEYVFSKILNTLLSPSSPLTSSLGTSSISSDNTDLANSADLLAPSPADSDDFSEQCSYDSDTASEDDSGGNSEHENYDSENYDSDV